MRNSIISRNKIIATLLIVAICFSVTAVNAFAAGTDENTCSYCAAEGKAGTPLAPMSNHMHVVDGKHITVDMHGNILDSTDYEAPPKVTIEDNGDSYTTTYYSGTRNPDTPFYIPGNVREKNTPEYWNNERAKLDSIMFTSGSRGSAESTGILGGKGVHFQDIETYDNLNDDVTWTLKDGVLVISGNGTANGIGASSRNLDPFCGNEHIKTLIVESGIIGTGVVLTHMPNLETAIIMGNNTRFTFADCPKLDTVITGANLKNDAVVVYIGDINEMTSGVTGWRDGNARNMASRNIKNTIRLGDTLHDYWDSDAFKTFSGARSVYDPGYSLKADIAKAKSLLDNAHLPSWAREYLPAELGGQGKTTDLTANMKVSEWAREYLQTALESNMVPVGLLDMDFTKPITRANFCWLAYQTLNGKNISYSDIAPDDGYVYFDDMNGIDSGASSAVSKFANAGIINGYGNNKFGPNDTLTREQGAVIMARIADAIGKPMTAVKTPFTDTNTAWSADGIAKCYGAGVVNGTTATTYSPTGAYTGEQAVVMLVRLVDYYNK